MFFYYELKNNKKCIGQVVIFSYLLVHGSFANTSDHVRRMLLFQVCQTKSQNPERLNNLKWLNNKIQSEDDVCARRETSRDPLFSLSRNGPKW